MKRMGQTLQRHVKSTIPSHHLRSRSSEHRSKLTELDLRAFSQVGRLVQLPYLCFLDFIIGVGNDWLGHVGIGLIVPDLLVGELVFKDLGKAVEGVEGAMALIVHGCSKEHNPRSSIEVANGELNHERFTSLRRRYPTPRARDPFCRFQ